MADVAGLPEAAGGGGGPDQLPPPAPAAAAAAGRVVALINCEDCPRWQKDGRQRELYRARLQDDARAPGGGAGAGAGALGWEHYKAWEGELPAEADVRAGRIYAVVVTGSHHSVNDPAQAWIPPLLQFLRFCIGFRAVSMFGVCFGHQAIAAALGARVVKNPDGAYRLGVEEITPSPALLAMPDYRKACSVFKPSQGNTERGALSLRVIESHGEQVVGLPPEAVVLASSRCAEVEAFSVGNRILGFQSHPEFDLGQLREDTVPHLHAKGYIDDAGRERALRELQGPLDDGLILFMAKLFIHHNCRKSLTGTEDLVARKIEQLSVEMFENVAKALQAEFKPTILEYQVLARMNKVASENYSNMADFASGIAVFVDSLKKKNASLIPVAEKIDEMESQVDQMEAIVQQLDIYSRNLETRARTLQIC